MKLKQYQVNSEHLVQNLRRYQLSNQVYKLFINSKIISRFTTVFGFYEILGLYHASGFQTVKVATLFNALVLNVFSQRWG